jgi:CxxC-x17-CxxC domain-containing protein
MGFRDRDFGGRGRDKGRGNSRGFGGGRSGGRSFGGRDRDFGGRGNSGFGDRERKPLVDVVCDKCGKDCQVPFKPTGDKPVYCSKCFEGEGNGRRSFSGGNSGSSGITAEQFNELNTKVDKILEILENVEFEDVEDEEVEDEAEVEKQ